jgi:divalent metal cation (Fe/Co/Zn/Cd) transporter
VGTGRIIFSANFTDQDFAQVTERFVKAALAMQADGWWWADAIAGLVIAAFAIREGIEAWRGDACATSVGMLLEEEHDDDHHR